MEGLEPPFAHVHVQSAFSLGFSGLSWIKVLALVPGAFPRTV